MTFDLTPKANWAFPSLRPWFDEDDLLPFNQNSASGLSISEDDKNVYVEAHLPGLKQDDIEVTFHKGDLWVRGERKEEEKDKKRKYYRIANSSYSYRISIPGEIDEKAEPDAVYKDGVMKVTFKKTAKVQPKKITVKKG